MNNNSNNNPYSPRKDTFYMCEYKGKEKVFKSHGGHSWSFNQGAVVLDLAVIPLYPVKKCAYIECDKFTTVLVYGVPTCKDCLKDRCKGM